MPISRMASRADPSEPAGRDSITRRVAETTRIPPESLTEAPPFPPRVKIEVTARCDLRCSFCSLTFKPRQKGDIEPALLRRLLDELVRLGVRDVGLFWLGEPLLCEELPEHVAYAKSAGIPYVFVTTNGRAATPERLGRLMQAGIDSIKFSLNAGDAAAYRLMCGANAFDAVVSNIRAAHALRGASPRPRLYASTACDPSDPRPYRQVHALIADAVDQHYLLPFYGPPARVFPGGRSLEGMLPCWSLFTEPHVSYDGRLSACFCDHDAKHHVADLRQTTLAEGWVSPRFRELRRAHLARDVSKTPCRDCVAYPSLRAPECSDRA